MPAQNGLIGNQEIDLPTTRVSENELLVERSMAKFSKTKEYQKLKEHMESRIKFYQHYLPNGDSLASVDTQELGNKWIIANSIITELNAILLSYELAGQAVEDVERG